MAHNITPGTHRIVSKIEGNPPTSVHLGFPAWQTVYLNGPVTTWNVKPIGDKKYLLRLGGYSFVGVINGSVTASIYPEQNLEWIATYREHQDAYTIEPVKNAGYGWTVADPSYDHSPITIRKIEAHYINEPYPIFLTTQLFKVEPARRE